MWGNSLVPFHSRGANQRRIVSRGDALPPTSLLGSTCLGLLSLKHQLRGAARIVNVRGCSRDQECAPSWSTFTEVPSIDHGFGLAKIFYRSLTHIITSIHTINRNLQISNLEGEVG